ncbi:MAG: hypothetical protein AB7E47_13430 [Desulfovibrionaceae bacterium]
MKRRHLAGVWGMALCAVLLCMPSGAAACGTVRMFGALYFSATTSCCKAQALERLTCVTPLPARYWQTPEAQETLRLVLVDAMRHGMRSHVEEVLRHYLPFDKYGYLKDLQRYRPTAADGGLMERLRAEGEGDASILCRQCGSGAPLLEPRPMVNRGKYNACFEKCWMDRKRSCSGTDQPETCRESARRHCGAFCTRFASE